MDALEQELLAAIERDPEDPAPYLVYADWLQGRGDVRGELMTLQGATEDRPGDHRISDAALDHVRAHAAYYLGPLAPFVDETDYLQLGWRCGFIASAILTWNRRWQYRQRPERPADEVLTDLLQLESARFLTRLVVEPTTDAMDWLSFTKVLASHTPATLRELHLGPRDDWSALRDTDLGYLSLIASRVPRLRELRVYGRPRALGTLELPELRAASIQLEAGIEDYEASTVMRELAAANWPRIERLQIWGGGSVDAMTAVLRRDDWVVLGELGIHNCAFADPMCGAIVRSPLAPQLFRLTLAKGTLTDAGVATLLSHAAQLPSLATIDVSETFVTEAGVRELRRLAPEVVARDLRTGPPRILIPALTREPDDD